MLHKSVRLILDDGTNIELFDAGYDIHKRADGTPSDINIFNPSASFLYTCMRIEALVVDDSDLEPSINTYTRNDEGVWGWYYYPDW